MDKPRHVHLMAAYRVLKYLKGFPGQGILLKSKSDFQLSAYLVVIGLVVQTHADQ